MSSYGSGITSADTGLYDYRARAYDPEIGRFLSEDPIGFEGGINLSAYAGNNPINATDPTGLDFEYYGVQGGISQPGLAGTGQVAMVRDLSGSAWNPYSYHVMGTVAGGGQTSIAGASFTGVYGRSTADQTSQLAGPSVITGFSGGQFLQGGYDRVTGKDYTSNEVRFGVGGSLFLPFEVHGMAARTAIESVPNLVLDGIQSTINFFIGGRSGGASGGFVLYPAKRNTNQIRVYSK